jgi:hypothetical protein
MKYHGLVNIVVENVTDDDNIRRREEREKKQRMNEILKSR